MVKKELDVFKKSPNMYGYLALKYTKTNKYLNSQNSNLDKNEYKFKEKII